MNKIIGNLRGFTLIEVLIGVIFLAIGLLAMASLQVASVRGNFFTNNLMQATYVAQDRLEFLKNLPIQSAQLQAGSYSDGRRTISGIPFSRTYTVALSGDIRTIHYTVSWNDGVNHSITFSTLRSQ